MRTGLAYPGQYTFTLDGKPFTPRTVSLSGTPDQLQAGDLVFVSEIPMVLDEPGQYDFRVTKGEGCTITRVVGNDEYLIGLYVGQWYLSHLNQPEKHGEYIDINPLAGLRPEQIRRLRGICLGQVTKALQGVEADLDYNHVCISIGAFVTGQMLVVQSALPPLPSGIQYFHDSSPYPVKDWSRLKTLKELEFLHTGEEDTFDCSTLSECRKLRYLRLSPRSLIHTEALAGLHELRVLDLTGWGKLADIEFVRGMPELRVLDVTNLPELTSLGPIDTLTHLDTVHANRTGVETLPERPIPNLKRLYIMSAPVSDESLRGFTKANPQCKLDHNWTLVLKEALAGITRISVGSLTRTADNKWGIKELFNETESSFIKQWVDRIEIDEEQSWGICACKGGPFISFYKGDECIVTMSVHHGRSLRWEGWPVDGVMTDSFAEYLCDWLAGNGISYPKMERDEARQKGLLRFPRRPR